MAEAGQGLLGFARLLEKLTSPAAPDACFRILDTVFFLPSDDPQNSRPRVRWYYTTKTGSVAEKRQEHVTARKLMDRFAKFALANPNNSAGLVARLMAANTSHMLLNKQQLETHLASLWHSRLLAEPVAVQVYLRPQNGKEVFVESFSGSSPDGGGLEAGSSVRYTGAAADKPVAASIQQQVAQTTDQLYAALAGTAANLRSRFVVDDNGQPWITSVFVDDPPSTAAGTADLSGHFTEDAMLEGEDTLAAAVGTPQAARKRPNTNPSSSNLERAQPGEPRMVASAGSTSRPTKVSHDAPAPGWPSPIDASQEQQLPSTTSTQVVEDVVDRHAGAESAKTNGSTQEKPVRKSQRNSKLQPSKELQLQNSPYVADRRASSSSKKPRRKSHETGPDMLLLAQFAAEKQRAMEIMAASLPATSPKPPKRAERHAATTSDVDQLEQLALARLAAAEKPAAVTTHEEAFMTRRLSSTAPTPQPAQPPQIKPTTAPDAKAGRAIRDLELQVELLEAQVKVLEHKLAETGKELSDADEKSREAARQLTAARSEHERRVSQLQAEHQAAMLEAQEAANRKIAELLTSTQRSPAKGSSSLSLAEQAEAAEAQATAQYQRLREQLLHAQQELVQGQQQWAKERKALFAEFNSKLTAQEQRLRAELSGTKSSIATLEDVLAAKDDQIADLKQQLVTAGRREADIERRAQAVELEATKLQADLKAMQQSVAASTRIELARGINVDDPKSAIRAVEAKSEAKVRQLNNKLEFLKAQIATEQQAREELEKALEASRRKVDEVRDEQRTRLQEVEQRNQDALQEVEDNLRRQYEDRMIELTAMQTKVSVMQNQMQEALQDSAAAKHKEESMRANANRLEVQLMAARRDIEQYRKEIAELRQTLEEYDQRQASQASTDATIRRLDNERQYLRSQLTSEITHKAEIQESLLATQQQLVDTKAQWERDVQTLREQARLRMREHDSTVADLLKEKNDLEASSSRFERQATELREAYTKLREQLRGREDDMDAFTIQYRKLQDELTANKEELARYQRLNEQYRTQAEENVSTVQASMEELLDQKRKEVKELQAQLAAQFSTVSSLQRDMLAQHHAQQNEKRAWTRQRGVVMLVANLQQCMTRNFVRRLGKWKMFTTQSVLKDLMQGVMKRELEEAHEQAHKQQEAAVQKCAMQMRKEHRLAMEAATEAHNEAMAKLKAALMEDKDKDLQDQHDEFVRLAAEQDQVWQSAAVAMRRELYEVQCMMAEEHDERMLRSAEQAAATLQRVNAKHTYEIHGLQQKLLESEKEIAALHADIEMLCSRHGEEVAQLRAEHEAASKRLCAEFDVRQEAALAAQLKQLDERQAKALAAAEKEKLAAIEAERNAGLAQIAAALEKANREHEDRIAAERAEFAAQLDAVKLEHEKRVTELVDEKERQLNERHQQAMEAAREASFAERAQAVAVEAAKWKRTLKEADARFQADSKQSFERGAAEATARLELRLQQAMNQYAEDLARHKNAWEQERKTLVSEHQQRVATLIAEKEAEKLEAVREAESALLVKLQASHDAKVSLLVEELEKKHRADLSATEAAEKAKREQLESRWSLEKQALEEIRNGLRQQMAKESAAHQQAVQELQDALQAQRVEFEHAQQQLLHAHAKALENQQNELDELKAAELEELARKCMEEQRDAMAKRDRELHEQHQRHLTEVQAAHAEKLAELVGELTAAKDEAESLEQQLQERTRSLQEGEQLVLQLERELSAAHKDHSVTTWQLMVKGMASQRALQQKLIATQRESVAALEELQHECQDRLDEAKRTTAKVVAALQRNTELQTQMKDVLVSHKADILAERRKQIQALEGEVQQIIDERGELLDNKAAEEEETTRLEEQVTALEEEIRSHSKHSSVHNGRVNVAHARKKRRLDEDLERLLEQIEQKRATIAKIDAKLAELSDRQDAREAESVRMEQELVQVLIEQQKLLLGLLAEGKHLAEEGKHLARSASSMSIAKPSS